MRVRARRRQQRREQARALRRLRGSPTFRALWSGAMALAGPAGAALADSPADRWSVEYNHSFYKEDDLDIAKGLVGGETGRYEIEMQQFSVRAPFSDRWDLALDIVIEEMSGASPMYVVPDAAGQPVQVMSGASIEDERRDFLVTSNRYFDNGRLGFSGGHSSEKDYSAINAGIDGETHFNEGNTTLSAGLGMSFDTIEPTDAALFTTRPDEEDKQTYSVLVGLSQILNRATLLQTSLTYQYGTGYLSDPYKQVFVLGGIFLPDERPDVRHQFAWLSRFRGHVRELAGTLHADYTFSWDDWGINANTFEIAWYQKLGENLLIVPSARYYAQSQSSFYVPYFATPPPVGSTYSSDYRLSSYGSLELGIKAEYTASGRWTLDHDIILTLTWDRYFSSEDLSLQDHAQEAPGLVSYSVFTVGIGLRW